MSSQSNQNYLTRTMNGIQSFDDGMGTLIEDGVVKCASFTSESFTANTITANTITTDTLSTNTINAYTITAGVVNAPLGYLTAIQGETAYYSTGNIETINGTVGNIGTLNTTIGNLTNLNSTTIINTGSLSSGSISTATFNVSTINSSNIYGEFVTLTKDIECRNIDCTNVYSQNIITQGLTSPDANITNVLTTDTITNADVITSTTVKIGASPNQITIEGGVINGPSSGNLVVGSSANRISLGSGTMNVSCSGDITIAPAGNLSYKSVQMPVFKTWTSTFTSGGSLGDVQIIVSLPETVSYRGAGFLLNAYNANYAANTEFNIQACTPSLANATPNGSFNRVRLWCRITQPSTVHTVNISCCYLPV